jgi:hypothetical protein
MRNDLVSNKRLATRGRSLGLHELIIKTDGTGVPSDNMVANTFEAVLGAISMDAGERSFVAVRDALRHMGFFEHPLLARISNLKPITTGLGPPPFGRLLWDGLQGERQNSQQGRTPKLF